MTVDIMIDTQHSLSTIMFIHQVTRGGRVVVISLVHLDLHRLKRYSGEQSYRHPDLHIGIGQCQQCLSIPFSGVDHQCDTFPSSMYERTSRNVTEDFQKKGFIMEIYIRETATESTLVESESRIKYKLKSTLYILLH